MRWKEKKITNKFIKRRGEGIRTGRRRSIRNIIWRKLMKEIKILS
jgi:hypothetical protein